MWDNTHYHILWILSMWDNTNLHTPTLFNTKKLGFWIQINPPLRVCSSSRFLRVLDDYNSIFKIIWGIYKESIWYSKLLAEIMIWSKLLPLLKTKKLLHGDRHRTKFTKIRKCYNFCYSPFGGCNIILCINICCDFYKDQF